MLVWLADAAFAQRDSVARWQRHIHHGDLRQLAVDFPCFVAQAGLAALRFQRFPYPIGQEANQNMSLHPLRLLVPDRAQLQIGLLDVEGVFGFGRLDVGPPQFFRGPVENITAQQIAAFA